MPVLATAATLAALAGAGPDPALYASDVPAGRLEQGTIAFSVTGGERHRIRYWAVRGRFRTVTRDARTGEVVATQRTTRRGTTIRRDGRTARIPGREQEPRPGWSSAYARKLLRGDHFAEAGTRTVAGLEGVVHRGKLQPGGSRLVLVVERGTGIALQRTMEGPDGFVQDEVLLERTYVRASRRAIERAGLGVR